MTVDGLELAGQPVVFPQPDGVEGGEARLLVDSLVPRHLAVSRHVAGLLRERSI